MTDDLETRLRELGQGVTVSPAAIRLLADGVRRRRRRRTAIVGAAAATALALGAVTMAVHGRGADRSAPTANDDSAYTGFRCAGPEALDQVPPLPDVEVQRAIVDEVSRIDGDGFVVEAALPTPIGVIALVGLEGATLDQARTELATHGVVDVARREPSEPDDGDPLSPEDQVGGLLSNRVQDVAPQVDRVVRGRPGFVELWHWGDAASIPVFWHGEVPPDVAALAEQPFGNGVRVTIQQVPYAAAELRRAQDRVTRALSDGGEVESEWSMVGRCTDNTGIRVGVPTTDPAVRSDLSRRLSDLVGMGVMVTFEPRMSLQ